MGAMIIMLINHASPLATEMKRTMPHALSKLSVKVDMALMLGSMTASGVGTSSTRYMAGNISREILKR